MEENNKLDFDDEDKKTLCDFFYLLYKIDKRNNPDLYMNDKLKINVESNLEDVKGYLLY